MPDRPDFHQVRGAAPENEQTEHPENPIEGDIAALAYQVNQRDRDAVIGKRDYAVRDDVQPHDLRIPQIASAVWQEIRRRQLFEKFQCWPALVKTKTPAVLLNNGRNVRQLTIVRNLHELELRKELDWQMDNIRAPNRARPGAYS